MIHHLESFDAPWPILLQRVADGLRRRGDYSMTYRALTCLSTLRRPELKFVEHALASSTTVLERLFELDRSYSKQHGPMPFLRLDVSDFLYAILFRLPSPLQRVLVSPLYDRPIPIDDLIAQVEAVVVETRLRSRIADTLPNEILINIGNMVSEREDLDWSFADDGDYNPNREGHRVRDRVALTAVCRRWRKLFGLKEFWKELILGDWSSSKIGSLQESAALGQTARQVLDVFLAKGGLERLDTSNLSIQEQLAPVLEVMHGRVGGLKSWKVYLPDEIHCRHFWAAWKTAFHLEQLWIAYGVLTLPPRRLKPSCITRLNLEYTCVDLLALLALLPNLETLHLSQCDFEIEKHRGTLAKPVAITLPSLTTLKWRGAPDIFYDAGTVFFSLPQLADLSIGWPDTDVVHAFLPPAPHPPYDHLVRLSLPDLDDTDQTLSILNRHPSIVDLEITGPLGDKGEPGQGQDVFTALAIETCPDLRILRVRHPKTGEPLFGKLVLAVVAARTGMMKDGEETVAVGRAATLLKELHVEEERGGGGGGMVLSEEERWYLWSRLEMVTGCGERPK